MHEIKQTSEGGFNCGVNGPPCLEAPKNTSVFSAYANVDKIKASAFELRDVSVWVDGFHPLDDSDWGFRGAVSGTLEVDSGKFELGAQIGVIFDTVEGTVDLSLMLYLHSERFDMEVMAAVKLGDNCDTARGSFMQGNMTIRAMPNGNPIEVSFLGTKHCLGHGETMRRIGEYPAHPMPTYRDTVIAIAAAEAATKAAAAKAAAKTTADDDDVDADGEERRQGHGAIKSEGETTKEKGEDEFRAISADALAAAEDDKNLVVAAAATGAARSGLARLGGFSMSDDILDVYAAAVDAEKEFAVVELRAAVEPVELVRGLFLEQATISVKGYGPEDGEIANLTYFGEVVGRVSFGGGVDPLIPGLDAQIFVVAPLSYGDGDMLFAAIVNASFSYYKKMGVAEFRLSGHFFGQFPCPPNGTMEIEAFVEIGLGDYMRPRKTAVSASSSCEPGPDGETARINTDLSGLIQNDLFTMDALVLDAGVYNAKQDKTGEDNADAETEEEGEEADGEDATTADDLDDALDVDADDFVLDDEKDEEVGGDKNFFVDGVIHGRVEDLFSVEGLTVDAVLSFNTSTGGDWLLVVDVEYVSDAVNVNVTGFMPIMVGGGGVNLSRDALIHTPVCTVLSDASPTPTG